ncbi:hypothetical protein ABPG77_005590 [Micractinium sp. CCAP 211/92]
MLLEQVRFLCTFCWDGHVFKCANGGFRCEDGAGRCVSKSTYPHLPGRWTRYSCLNNKDFANGQYVKTCAPGTRCGEPKHPNESPCLRGSYHGDCPSGNGGCIDHTHYCENGVTYKCASGLRCTGYASSPLSGKGNAVADATAEQELLQQIKSLGYPAAIFPGDEQAREGIDAAVAALEAATPIPSPLQQPQRGGQPAPELLGAWRLVYASSGTYVTRTAAAQALLAASKLPGTLRITNAAKLGLFVFGEWALQITGKWRIQSSELATISFDGFSLQLVGLLGLIKLPGMAKISVPANSSSSAEFSTTYLSPSLRVARGRSRNIFVFERSSA